MKTVIADIRDGIGPVPQAERLVFTEIQGGPAGRAITIEVASEDTPVAKLQSMH